MEIHTQINDESSGFVLKLISSSLENLALTEANIWVNYFLIQCIDVYKYQAFRTKILIKTVKETDSHCS